jgi:hypothetical protein
MNGRAGLILMVGVVAVGCGSKHHSAASSLVSLPVVGCSTEHGDSTPNGVPTYLASSRGATLPAGAAKALAWYTGDVRHERTLRVLAPRGWTCSALIATDGGWSITVSPQGTDPSNYDATLPEEVSLHGSYNGPGASEACSYFQSAHAVGVATGGGSCEPGDGARVTLKGKHLAMIVAPPAGAIRFSTRRFLLWYPEDDNAAQGADCRLPGAQRSLCTAILNEALARLQSALARVAATVVTTPTTTAKSSLPSVRNDPQPSRTGVFR